jgi:hypothetical protein
MDYQLTKQLLRQGVILPSRHVLRKLKDGVLLTRDEGYGLRLAGLTALVELSTRTELAGDVLDNYYWLNRTICTDPEPLCVEPQNDECPFLASCPKFADIGRPLEETRYY